MGVDGLWVVLLEVCGLSVSLVFLFFFSLNNLFFSIQDNLEGYQIKDDTDPNRMAHLHDRQKYFYWMLYIVPLILRKWKPQTSFRPST